VGAKATMDLDLGWLGALQDCVCGVVMCVICGWIREMRKCISRKRGACILYLQDAGCRDCVQRHVRIEKVSKTSSAAALFEKQTTAGTCWTLGVVQFILNSFVCVREIAL
jgi:hypothetical protein